MAATSFVCVRIGAHLSRPPTSIVKLTTLHATGSKCNKNFPLIPSLALYAAKSRLHISYSPGYFGAFPHMLSVMLKGNRVRLIPGIPPDLLRGGRSRLAVLMRRVRHGLMLWKLQRKLLLLLPIKGLPRWLLRGVATMVSHPLCIHGSDIFRC
jgi:hypothetical protein